MSDDAPQDEQARTPKTRDDAGPPAARPGYRSGSKYRGPRHRVRPRWVWAALVLMIAGAAVLGWGVIQVSWPWSIAGLVVLGVGGVAALWGGLLYDIHGHSKDAVEGEEHTVPGPLATAADPGVRRRVAEEDHVLAAERHRPPPKPTLHRLGAVILLAVAAWLLLSQWTLYANTVAGKEGTMRALGAGIVVGLAGLRLHLSSRSLLAVALSALAGVGLVLGALLAAHDRPASMVSELVAGVLVLSAAAPAARTSSVRLGRPD